jgi:EmrB/QacA subfamily drug resistance transporter
LSVTKQVRLASAAGRWTVAAAVLGSGAAFLEGTVVNVALPAIGRDFHLGIDGLQWVVNGYLLTLSALILLGGSLGDLYERRSVFIVGAAGFGAASALCAFAPSFPLLVGFRLIQGMFAALLVPNSLAVLNTVFVEEDRAGAIGLWAGWSAASTALGPLLGGWVVDAISWRGVFVSVVPFAVAAAWLAWRHVPAGGGSPVRSLLDYAGGVLGVLGLGGVTAALISGPRIGFGRTWILIAGMGGLVSLAGFMVHEARAPNPLLPMKLFSSRQFAGANLVTLLVYAALGGMLFFLILQLQLGLHYTALQAGAALLPANALMLLLSGPAGRWSGRRGARWPMTIGSLTAAGGFLLLTRVQEGASYVIAVLPAVFVFGLGLGTLVAPLTAAVLAAVPKEQAGIASGVNNAAARFAGLIATAALPVLVGLGSLTRLDGKELAAGYVRAMWIGAGLCVAGAAVAFRTVKGALQPTANDPQQPDL